MRLRAAQSKFVYLLVLLLCATLISCASTPTSGQQLSSYVSLLQEIYKNESESCYAWLTLPVKPALSIDTAQQKIIADDAARTGNYQLALDHYLQGLKSDPCWPEGYYNAALLMAAKAQELGDNRFYDPALDLMNVYLILAPIAPDAETVYAKMVVWSDKSRADRLPSVEQEMKALSKSIQEKAAVKGSIGVKFATQPANSIQYIYAGSPAAQAGLEVNDVVSSFDDKPVSGPDDVGAIEAPQQMWGATVPIEIIRNGKPMSLKITIAHIYYYTGVRAPN